MALGLGSEVSIGSRILGFSVAQESWNRASLNRCLCLPKALLLAGCHVLVGGWREDGSASLGILGNVVLCALVTESAFSGFWVM